MELRGWRGSEVARGEEVELRGRRANKVARGEDEEELKLLEAKWDGLAE